LGLAANVEGERAVGLLSEGWGFATIGPSDVAALATGAGSGGNRRGHCEFTKGGKGKGGQGSDEGYGTHGGRCTSTMQEW